MARAVVLRPDWAHIAPKSRSRHPRTPDSDTGQQTLHRGRGAGWESLVLRKRRVEDRLLRSAHAGTFREFALPDPPAACRSALRPAPTAISGSPRKPATASAASAWRRDRRIRASDCQGPGRTVSLSAPMAISGSPRATPICIARITPDGRVTEFGAGITPGSRPLSIVARDGALWFSEAGGSRVARMTLDGKVTEFQIPTRGQPAARHGVASATAASGSSRPAPTRSAASRRDGTIEEFAIPTPDASARSVAVTA